MEDPSQRIGDYSLTRSEHETGRVFSSVKDLGVPGGVEVGEEVRTRFRSHQLLVRAAVLCFTYLRRF